MTVADQEQLEILRQGVEVWNKWREENPDVGIDLNWADLSGADLSSATLWEASLIETNLTRSVLTNFKIYGISARNLKLEGVEQSNLVITRHDEPTVTVDNLEVAQLMNQARPCNSGTLSVAL